MTVVVLRAELTRVARSRPLRVLLLVAGGVTVLIGYLAVHALLGLIDDAGDPEVASRLADLGPARLRQGMTSVTTTTLPVLALLTGGLVVRADLRGNLMRLLVGRGVDRTALAWGKVGALVVCSVAAAGVTTMSGLAAAVLLSSGPERWAWPPVADVATLLAVAAASWLAWSLLGLAASLLLRSSHAATGLALTWLVAAGPLTSLAQQPGAARELARLNPAGAVEQLLSAPATGSPGEAVLTLVAIVAALAGLSVLGMRHGRVA